MAHLCVWLYAVHCILVFLKLSINYFGNKVLAMGGFFFFQQEIQSRDIDFWQEEKKPHYGILLKFSISKPRCSQNWEHFCNTTQENE